MFTRKTASALLSSLIAAALAACLTACLAACGGGEQRTLIQNKGSDTLVNVAQAWAEAYQTVHPGVVVAVSGGGSGTGIAAVINGTVDIANSSREIEPDEIALAEKNGQHPVQHVVGYDALAIFLHADNPIDEMTIAQLKDIYVDGGSVTQWTDLGVEVPGCKDQEIVVVSRQNNSGTYAYFRKAVLGAADYRLGTRDMHGSKDVVDLVEKTPCAIGYSGLAYATDHVKMPCVAAATRTASRRPSPVRWTAATRSRGRCSCTRTASRPVKSAPTWIGSRAMRASASSSRRATLRIPTSAAAERPPAAHRARRHGPRAAPAK
jgi:phosphate transport system substrate-binding protein